MKTNKIPNKLFIGLWLIFGFLSLSVFISNICWDEHVEETRKEIVAIKNNKNPKKFAIRKHSTLLNQKNNSKTIIVKRNKKWKKR